MAAHAQNFPTKPIRIVTASPGSSTDLATRVIAQGLSSAFGQPVVVENRGGGFLQGETVAKAAPDGYTLANSASGLWVTPLLREAPYDPIKDLTPIAWTTTTPNVLYTHPSVAASSVGELIALAKAKPGVLNWAAGQVGSSSHLASVLFNALAGVNIVHVPYKSQNQSNLDLLAGAVQVSFNSLEGLYDQVKIGKLKALGVGSTKPSTLLPGVPTIASSLPGFESGVNLGMFAPARTPQAVILRINQEVVRVLSTSEARSRLATVQIEPVASSPQELRDSVAAERARVARLVKEGAIKM